jgi:hypothetical protein
MCDDEHYYRHVVSDIKPSQYLYVHAVCCRNHQTADTQAVISVKMGVFK